MFNSDELRTILSKKLRYCADCQYFNNQGHLSYCDLKDCRVGILDNACGHFLLKVEEDNGVDNVDDDKIVPIVKNDECKVCGVVDLKRMLKYTTLLKYMVLAEKNEYDNMECFDLLESLEHEIRLLNNTDTRIERIDWQL